MISVVSSPASAFSATATSTNVFKLLLLLQPATTTTFAAGLFNKKSTPVLPPNSQTPTKESKISMKRLADPTPPEGATDAATKGIGTSDGSDKPSDNLGSSATRMLLDGLAFPFPTLKRIMTAKRKKKSSSALSGKEADSDGFGLSLRESLVAIASYIGLGILSYHYAIEGNIGSNGENAANGQQGGAVAFTTWSIIESIYFSVVTFTTVG